MLVPKIGGVAAHPANVHRLLYDEEQLVLVFPEGRKGTEKLYKDRYRLRRFGRGGFVEAAMRAEAKLVPLCVVGAEEAMPAFAQVEPLLQKLTGLIYFPITPTFPWLGPLGMMAYLPAKFKIRFLEPIDTVALGGREAAQDKRARPNRGPGDPRADPGEPPRHAGQAKERVVRMSRRILLAGLSTYWGGRLAQALEGFEEVETIIGVDSVEPRGELERTEFVKVTNQHSLLSRIVRAAEIDTVIDTQTDRQLGHRPAAVCAREQRDRDHEHPHRVRGQRLAGPPVHLQELRPLLRLRAGRPRLLSRGDAAPASAANPARAGHRARPRPPSRSSPRSSPSVEVTILRCANVLGPDVDTAFTRMFDLPAVPMVLGFDPRIQFVHEDDVVHALEHCVFHETPGVYNVAADGVSALSEAARSWASGRRRSCRPGGRASSPARFAASASRSRARC